MTFWIGVLMGFGIGSSMLAVLIFAVIHRTKNESNKEYLDVLKRNEKHFERIACAIESHGVSHD